MCKLTKLFSVSICVFLLSCAPKPKTSSDELLVYSSRKEHLVKPLFDQFTATTGIKVRYLTDKAGALIEKLKAQGDKSPADVFMTVDAGNLWKAKQLGFFQAISSSILQANIPGHLRDQDGHWFGLSIRARTLIFNKTKVKVSEVSTYKNLADSRWKNRLCLRTAKKVYNQSMVAMFIEQYGEVETEKMLSGWVGNLAAPVFSNDLAVIKAVEAGQCDLGIVNSYYLGRHLRENKEARNKLELFWLNQKQEGALKGVHVNVSGAGVLKSSKNSKAAARLLEWLSGAEAQKIYANLNMEFPVVSGVELNDVVSEWGPFVQNKIHLSLSGKNQSKAIKVMDRSGYR